MRYALVTGTSRGLGESIANFLLESDVHVIGVSRSTNSKLQTKAKELNMNYYDLSFDLTNVNEVKEMINQAKEILTQDNVTTIYIVNNAGILEPMDQAKEIDSEKLIKHYRSEERRVVGNECIPWYYTLTR